jgi:pyridoxamine 5'-phosphate oxidase
MCAFLIENSPTMDIADLRRDYDRGKLSRNDMDPDPIKQFERWFAEAQQSGIKDPNAMSLATADQNGLVDLRTVLLKMFDEKGFVFFTNYESAKAKQIAQNPQVSILFPWLTLERQVKINGVASKISSAESLKYFMTRPRGSQLGAWVSEQSSIISSRALLLGKLEEIKQRFADGDISLPEFWGGYRIEPKTIEFWQGQPDRLHDRFQYSLETENNWHIDRLAP